MDSNTFRKYGYQMVDWIADYYEQVENYPVKSQVEPGEIKSQLSCTPPEHGEDMEEIMRDFQNKILPGITHWQHPNFFAYFPANTSPPSVLGDMLASGMGVLSMLWQSSPAATELEEVVLNWLKDMLSLPPDMKGVIQDNASTATLCALLAARETAADFYTNIEGVRKPLVVYTSEEAHSSVEKGVKIAGYGKDNLRYIPTDENFALLPEELEKAIREDKQQGFIPACVVATVGTTSSTAVDPVSSIGEICKRHNLWLHVDAAFSGSAAILEEKRYLLQGVELSDSCVINPHKWLLTNFDCSAFFVKDEEKLINTLTILPEYLKTNVDSQVTNYRDWGIQLGRGFRALKLWFVLRSYGVSGLQEILRNHISWANMFKDWVENDNRFEVMAPVHVSLVCFRFNDGSSQNKLNDINKKLLENINSTGEAFLTHTSLNDSFVLRMAIGQRLTEKRHIKETWDLISKKADELVY